MKRRFLLSITLIAMLLLTVVSVGAINFGQRDGGEHPYVGLVYSYLGPGQGGYVCSGTLMSPTVVLTAAHCLDVPAIAYLVSFTEQAPFNFVPGTAYPHPDYSGLTVPDTSDIGVVVLHTPVYMSTYGALPPAGFFDSIATARGLKGVGFTAVGYGLQDSQPARSNAPIEEWDIARYKGNQQLIEITSAFNGGYNVKLTNNPGNGNGSGGTCSGDSGGPIFQAGTNVVTAINSFGVAPYCKGNDFAYRTDTDKARAFLSQWLTLP